MKLISAFLTSLFFFASICNAQANNLPITVVANESITVTLFFPSEIKKVIKPAINYKFEFEQHSTMGTLVARKGATSNLTVITEDGSIFSFLLQYKQEVANFTYVLSTEQAIGSMNLAGVSTTMSETVVKERETETATDSETVEVGQAEEVGVTEEGKRLTQELKIAQDKPLVHGLVSNVEVMERQQFAENPISEASGHETSENNLYDTDRESYYNIFCENNYDQGVRMRNAPKAGKGIELQLNVLTADKNEFYFIFQMTNRLTSRFNPEKLRFYVRTSRKDEPLEITPIHVFNYQEYIEAGRTKKMVYVLEEFRLSKDQKVFVVLDELNGSRNTVLKIDSQTINTVGEKSLSSAR